MFFCSFYLKEPLAATFCVLRLHRLKGHSLAAGPNDRVRGVLGRKTLGGFLYFSKKSRYIFHSFFKIIMLPRTELIATKRRPHNITALLFELIGSSYRLF